MAKGADIGSKRLISLAPEAWVRWILGDVDIAAAEVISGDFQWVSRETDVLLRVQETGGSEFLVLNEVQFRYREDLPLRMRAYAALAEERYKLPVYPVLVNILNPGPKVVIPTSFRREFRGLVAQQDYRVINLWEFEAGEILAQQYRVLIPFVPIMRGGDETAILEQAAHLLEADPALAEMKMLLAFMATFVRDIKDIEQLLRWDMTALRESPIFNEIFKEGLEAGMAKGREVGLTEGREVGLTEGREVGLTEGRKQMALNDLLLILESRFGIVSPELKALLPPLSADQLHGLLRVALTVSSLEDFQEQVRHIHPLNGDTPL